MYPKSLQNLIDAFKSLPGVGAKTAERYALCILDQSIEDVEDFASSLLKVKSNIKTCSICGNITEGNICDICANENRKKEYICVVQHPKDIFAIEKTGYSGYYHVLNGAISTTKGILPDDINIKSLYERLEGIREVIIATNPTLDGETTALYLSKTLKERNVEVTRLAHGLPMGANLDYADELTLIKAMEGRIKQ
ncbi:MAG: recombination protein RecR [Erysipelotrichaceae bacterium]|nr:recombination protein RecR [Erysipelotrichaceae bacterium]MBR6517417.1 recombination protein RecR [Bacilli bacterium]